MIKLMLFFSKPKQKMFVFLMMLYPNYTWEFNEVINFCFQFIFWYFIDVCACVRSCSYVIYICRAIHCYQSMQRVKLPYIMRANMDTKILSSTWYRMLQIQSSIWSIIQRKYVSLSLCVFVVVVVRYRSKCVLCMPVCVCTNKFMEHLGILRDVA